MWGSACQRPHENIGTFRFRDLAAGSYRLHSALGTNPVPEWVADMVTVKVETGQTHRGVQVTASKGGFLAVKVLTKADGQTLAQASEETPPWPLPWLILADAKRRVAAEGFDLEELDSKIKTWPK